MSDHEVSSYGLLGWHWVGEIPISGFVFLAIFLLADVIVCICNDLSVVSAVISSQTFTKDEEELVGDHYVRADDEETAVSVLRHPIKGS